MDIFQCLDSLQLNDNFILDDKIQAVLADLMVAIEKWRRLLTHKRDSAHCKLNGKGLLVDGFEKSRSKFALHRDGCRND